MSSLTHDRLRTQRQIRWPLYREQREHLAELFAPIAHNGQAKCPLSIGIKYDLIGTNTGLSVKEVKHFLRAYTFGPKYLRTLKVGAWRTGLDGHIDGWVSPNEAAFAAMSLKAHYADRERRRIVREVGRIAAAGEDVAALMAQLREKSNWRSDIHSDLHRKSADVIGALMKERRTRPVSLDREAVAFAAGEEIIRQMGDGVGIRDDMEALVVKGSLDVFGIADAILALIEGRT